jgi:ATP-dependent Clp protease ATP-binding subunit ClpC
MQFAPNLNRLILLSDESAKKKNQDPNTPELFAHLLGGEKYARILRKLGLNKEAVIRSVSQIGVAFPTTVLGEDAEKERAEVFSFAQKVAEQHGHDFVDVEHVMVAILESSTTIRGWMALLNEEQEFPTKVFISECDKLLDFEKQAGSGDSSNEEYEDMPPLMQKFLTNITAEVANSGLSIFGREKEISELANIVTRQRKNNALLIGDEGVGRKSICRGLAERIMFGNVPDHLRFKTVYHLDCQKLVAGTSMFGAIEQRITMLAAELESVAGGDSIIVIPSLPVNVGKNQDSSVLNLIGPLVESDKIPVILICTQSEYKKNEKELHNFEQIKVSEPSKDETLKIALNTVWKMQAHHMVAIDFEAINTVIDLCQRFLPYRKFPEKALDVLDTILSDTKNKAYTPPESIAKIENKITEIALLCAMKGESEEQTRKKVEKLEEKFINQKEKWENKVRKNPPTISAKQAISAFAEKYKITESQIYQTQGGLVSDLSDNLKKEVFGQDYVVDQVSDILLCTKVGLRDVTKPIAKFLFAGGTGVGKTFLGKKIAKHYFGDEKAYLKIDMSEFQERGTVSGLIGTTAGYIGYENGGRLTEFVKHNPSCVVIFDEIEKAHSDVHNLLLQIMDDGCLTDGGGYKVDFTNTIVVLTTNQGSADNKRSMGFLNDKTTQSNYAESIKKAFRPEIIGRIDEVLVFNNIDEKTSKQIIWQSVNRVILALKDQNVILTIEDAVVDYLHKLTNSDAAHARAVQSSVRKHLETPIAKILTKDRPKKITALIDGGEIKIN